jgi:uridine kinase
MPLGSCCSSRLDPPERDAPAEGHHQAERLHRDRYHPAELVYVREVDPLARADIVIDNAELAKPVVVRW